MIKDFTKTSWRVGDMQEKMHFTLNGGEVTLFGTSSIMEIYPKRLAVWNASIDQLIWLVPANCPVMQPRQSVRDRLAMQLDD